MSQERWEVREYEDGGGASPFDDWLSTLDNKVQERVLVRLARLRLGNFGDQTLVIR